MLAAVPGSGLPLRDVQQRASWLQEARPSDVDRSQLPESYRPERPLEEVWATNLQFVQSLHTVVRCLDPEGRAPGNTSVGEVLERTPGWLAHQKRRGVAWALGGISVTGLGVGAVAASSQLMAQGTSLASVVGVGGMIGGLLGFAICVTMATEALGDHKSLRRAAEHLESWARVDQDRQRQEVEALVPAPGEGVRGDISDEASSVIVGEIRLPKKG